MVDFVDQSVKDDNLKRSTEVVLWNAGMQICAVLAGGLFFGLWHKSIAEAVNIIEIMMFWMAPMLGWTLRDAPGRALRTLGRWIIIGWAVFLLWVVLITADRLMFVNSKTYPEWLATAVTFTPEQARSDSLWMALCDGRAAYGGIEEKDNGAFMRCGFEWRPGNTYLIKNYRQALQWWWDAHPTLKAEGDK
jgi:hypothetical protein